MTDREKVINNVKEAIEIMERMDKHTCWDDYIRVSLENALVVLRAQNEADDQLANPRDDRSGLSFIARIAGQ